MVSVRPNKVPNSWVCKASISTHACLGEVGLGLRAPHLQLRKLSCMGCTRTRDLLQKQIHVTHTKVAFTTTVRAEDSYKAREYLWGKEVRE